MIEFGLRTEVFNGGVTGTVNVTRMIKSAEAAGRVAHSHAMYPSNVKDLLDSHEWDDTAQDRVAQIVASIARDRRIRPLIITEEAAGAGFGPGSSMYIVDGWHRLLLLYRSHVLHFNAPHVVFTAWRYTRAELEDYRVDMSSMLEDHVHTNPTKPGDKPR